MAFDFSEKLIDSDQSATLIVDALNLAFRWKHQGRTDFCSDYVRTVQSLARSYDCGNIIIAADWGNSTYRKEICEDYKQNRKDKFADQTEEEKEAFEQFFLEFERTLDELAESYTVLRFKGVEADDIAAHLVKNKSKYGLEKVWLISSDRDWDLLIQDDVSRFSYVTRKEVRADNWNEHYNVEPEDYISLKCLTGDKGDNVAGIPGIGPARASSLIKDYGSAMDIYDALPINSKYKFIQNLNNSGDQILINYQLMDLIAFCDNAIGADNISQIEGRMLSA
jgi:DNA polymerase-1